MDAAVPTDAGHVSFQMFAGNDVEKKLCFKKSPKENRMKKKEQILQAPLSLEVFWKSSWQDVIQRGGRVGSPGGCSPWLLGPPEVSTWSQMGGICWH